mgnify:CR=1 FL=1
MLIDTHAHINFKAFKDDADEVIQRSLSENTWMILVGSEYKSSKRALEYANKYQRGVYAAAGLHPIHLEDINENGEQIRAEEFNHDMYEKLAQFEKVVAIGEIGLDYFHLSHDMDVSSAKKKQKEVFIAQLELARQMDLPVIIHCRQAHDDMIALLMEFRKGRKELFRNNENWGVMHCFSGDEDLAWQYFHLGLLISFTGLVTFSSQWDGLLRKVPLDKLMIETDAPFMTPEPFRGKRNEPVLVEYVARRIAEVKGLTYDKIAEATTSNARNLFKI